jgi:hypothetical protein
MSEEQADWATQSLYENPGVRDELTDSEAKILLHWGEEQINRLAALDLDDISFETAYDGLSSLIKRINRLAARRAQLSFEDLEIAINRIAESAAMIGMPIPPEHLDAYVQQPASADNSENVRVLIALVMSGQQPTS